MILSLSYFNQSNEFRLPLPTLLPSEVAQNGGYITDLIQRVENDVLTNGLGYDLYNLLKATPTAPRFIKLINGDGKYEGLHKMLASRVKEIFIDENQETLANQGVQAVQAEKALRVSPQSQIAKFNQMFIIKYQEGFVQTPTILGNFTDWFGVQNPNRLSLFGYLRENQDVYPEWNIDLFTGYFAQNSFGL